MKTHVADPTTVSQSAAEACGTVSSTSVPASIDQHPRLAKQHQHVSSLLGGTVQRQQSAKLIQLQRYRGVTGKDGKKYWKPAKGPRIPAEGDANWAEGTVFDDEKNSYTSREERAEKVKNQKQDAAKRRVEETKRSDEVNKNRVIPGRQKAKYEKESEQAKAVLENRRKQKKPKLHRGITYDDIGSAQAATMKTLDEQLLDQDTNTISAERKKELIELTQEVAKRDVPYDFMTTDVPVRAVGQLGLATDTVGPKQPPEPLNQVRSATDDRGHLLTESMIPLSHRDTVANVPKNIIAEDSIVNQGYKRGIERWAENQVGLGNSVMQVSEPNFDDKDKDRPLSTMHHYVVTDKSGQPKIVSVELGNPVRKK